MVAIVAFLKARSHGAICDCDTITVAQNGYTTYSNAMSHIVHKDVPQSHHVNSIITSTQPIPCDKKRMCTSHRVNLPLRFIHTVIFFLSATVFLYRMKWVVWVSVILFRL